VLNWNIKELPERIYETEVAVTDEISSGTIDVSVISSISTSSVNTSPAMGALKIPPIAPAAPQPTSNISVFWSSLKNFPRFEPIAEPVSTMGASAPTDPPKPIVTELPTSDDHTL
jgi:hypothetical protein